MSKISCQSRENSLPARTKDERVFDTLYHRPLSGKTEDPCEQSKVCNQQFDTYIVTSDSKKFKPDIECNCDL